MKICQFFCFRVISFFILWTAFVPSGSSQHVLRGKVLDDSTKEAISQVTIYLPELNIITESDKQGHFVLKNLPGGRYNIQLSHIGYEPYIQKAEVRDSVTELTAYLEATLLELPEVVIYGSQNSNLRKTSFNITSLSYREMKENGSVSISDAMSRIPGMSQLSTGVGISKPVIRGLYGNRIQTVLMGMRFDNQQWQDEHGLGLSDMGTDRIEIIKGPSSLLYGSEAMGGVLNIIEEKPAEIGKTKIDLNTQFFSNTLGNATNIGIRKSTEKRSFRLRGGFESHADYSDGNNQRVLNSRFKGYHVKSSLEFHSARRVTIFNFMSSFSKFGFIMEDNFDRKQPDSRFSRKMDGPNHSVFFNILTMQNTFFREKSKIKLNLGAHTNLRLENEGGNRVSLNMWLTTLASDIQWTGYAGKNTELTLGTQAMVQKNANYGARKIVPDATLWEAGAFGFIKHSVNFITLEAGLRYDHKNIRTFPTDPVNTTGTNVFPFSRPYDVLNGSLGTSILFLRHWNLKLNGSSGYRAPNLAELSSNGLHEGTFRLEIGNSYMKVEQNLNLEASLNFEVKELYATASVYRNRMLNYIYLAPAGTQYLGFDIYHFIQKTSTIQGGEAQVVYNPAWLEMIHLTGSYSVIEAKTDDGAYLPFIPANRFMGEVRVNFKDQGKVSRPFVKAGIIYVLEQNKPAQFETSTPAYDLFNAALGSTIQWGKIPLTITVSGNNLFNKTYFDHLSRFKYYGIYNIGRNITLNIYIPVQ